MNKLYCLADVYITTSRSESFGLTIVESLCCNTPVVAFNVGGVSDIIDHKINGYLAEPFNMNDIKNGLVFVEKNMSGTEVNTRQNIVEKFSLTRIREQYISLYKKLLSEKAS